MAITIPSAYIETFESTIRHLAQQKKSRLRHCISEVNKQSEKHNWDMLAPSIARAKHHQAVMVLVLSVQLTV